MNRNLIIFVAAVCALVPARASGYAYFSEESLLSSFFPGQAPERVPWHPTSTQREIFKAKVGYSPPVAEYTWFVVSEHDAPVGYALIDEQLGQHEPITFGVQLRPDATIERIEVMVYREMYGDGVRSERFRTQFVGLDFANPMRAGKEIQIVSGATISTRALSTGARRASALLSTWLGQ